ncbi:MAG: class B sortase [[Clostridium] scindens]
MQLWQRQIEEKRHHRGRRRKRKGGVLSNLILAVAVVVFCVSGFQLIRIGKGYLDGRSEYEKVRDVALTNPDEQEGFRVDFEELMKINPDTVGWIRFYPEPSQINYPIVQGQDNDKYLHQTFSANENTLGAIFLNVDNKADFSDRNSIIYGHRMKDGSMFRHLQDYEEKVLLGERIPIFTSTRRTEGRSPIRSILTRWWSLHQTFILRPLRTTERIRSSWI